MTCPVRRLTAALLAWTLLGTVPVFVRQQEQLLVSAPPRVATFDLVALDNAGKPVLDLTPADLVVAIDGRPAPIRSLRYVFRGAGANELALGGLTTAPSVAVSARMILIAVDEATVRRGRERAVTSAVWRVIDRLTPADLVGVTALPAPRGQTSLVTDREPLRTALNAVTGRATAPLLAGAGQQPFGTTRPTTGEPIPGMRDERQESLRPDDSRTVAPALDAASDAPAAADPTAGSDSPVRRAPSTNPRDESMRTLSVLLEELAKVPGQKVIVYVTGGDDALQPRESVARSTLDLVEAAVRARVALHVIRVPDTEGLQSDASLEQLAKDTGGTLTIVRPRKADLGPLVAALSGGYLVELHGVSPGPGDRTAALSVQTTRKSLRLAVASRWSQRDDPIPELPPAPAITEAAPSDASSASTPRRSSREPDLPAHDGELDAVVAKVASYVDTYLAELGSVVAEEAYMQIVRSGFRATNTRRTRADLLLLRSPSGWLPFRDVFEVDGRPVRDREDRLKRLFLENPGEALKEGRRISDESARHNIGSAYRTINMPTLTLAFFQAKFVAGFRFQRRGTDTLDGETLWRVDFREVASPTQIANASTSADMPSTGTLWVEPASGRIVKTLLRNGDDGGVAEITVKFRPNDTLGLWTPVQMQENYSTPSGRRETISTEATYSGFRRFQVATAEAVADPK